MAQQRLLRWGSRKLHPFPETPNLTLAGEDPAPGLGELEGCAEILTQLALLSLMETWYWVTPSVDLDVFYRLVHPLQTVCCLWSWGEVAGGAATRGQP